MVGGRGRDCTDREVLRRGGYADYRSGREVRHDYHEDALREDRGGGTGSVHARVSRSTSLLLYICEKKGTRFVLNCVSRELNSILLSTPPPRAHIYIFSLPFYSVIAMCCLHRVGPMIDRSIDRSPCQCPCQPTYISGTFGSAVFCYIYLVCVCFFPSSKNSQHSPLSPSYTAIISLSLTLFPPHISILNLEINPFAKTRKPNRTPLADAPRPSSLESSRIYRRHRRYRCRSDTHCSIRERSGMPSCPYWLRRRRRRIMRGCGTFR
mmetsp:Transcript_35828/g.106927  ORF Transcript_35828/g.106927 Transcript_35828/m.106927 type:complete len:266 (+) Transcript_35828:1657-2454(+)